ncbi:hypothetical protein EP342_01880 [bacterium]|nr:MAG: hypothetical protein EP342_01880 [bacterium]
MDEALKIIAIIALSSLTILIIFGFVFITKSLNLMSDVSKNLDKITENFIVLKTRFMITLEEVTETREDVKDLKEKSIEHLNHWKVTSDKTNQLLDSIQNGTDSVIKSIEPYERLINRSYERLAPPIDKATTFVSAFTKAIAAFSSRLSNNKQ